MYKPTQILDSLTRKKIFVYGSIIFILILFLIYAIVQSNKKGTVAFDPIRLRPARDLASTSPSPNTGGETERQRLLRERPLGLPCLKQLKKFCVIRADDQLLRVMKLPLKETIFTVNGQKVYVDNLYFQIAFQEYTDEPVSDSAGKVITSAQKEYDLASKSLTIYVGVVEDYYRMIPDDQQKQLYLAQIVRSLLAMTSGASTDFTRTFDITSQLHNWSPQF